MQSSIWKAGAPIRVERETQSPLRLQQLLQTACGVGVPSQSLRRKMYASRPKYQVISNLKRMTRSLGNDDVGEGENGLIFLCSRSGVEKKRKNGALNIG
jgi:hypothetical protein